jgi:steroid delta-isomerase-like uncharacterized protein
MPQTETKMSRAEMTRLNRRFAEVFSAGDVDALDELVAPDFIEHSPSPGQGPGRQGLKDWVGDFHAAFSDARYLIEDEIVEGDRIVVRSTISGRHTGDFLGVPATRKTFSVPSIDVVRVRDGRAVEHWGAFDSLAMLQQLGVTELPAVPVGA